MNKYEHLSKEELIRVLVRRDAERPLGLVWEREEIEFENKLNNNFVSLEINKELSVGEEPWDNLIIEGCILQDKSAENCNEKYRVLPPDIFTIFSTVR